MDSAGSKAFRCSGNFTHFFLLLLIFCGLFASGCANKQQQLEKIAKDWCMTIRASQVIPVYPLTEDVQPGDVFLVNIPMQKQVEVYKQKGFLPLDQRMTRLDLSGYRDFYDSSYGITSDSAVPRNWQFPVKQEADSTTSEFMTSNNGQSGWSVAPGVAFPTYSFEIDERSSLEAAFPIQGVAHGFRLLNTKRASGSVAIKDTYTYGLPLDKIISEINKWAADNSDMLQKYALAAKESERFHEGLMRGVANVFTPTNKPTVYLRVINRVYLTQNVIVSMNEIRSSGVRADVRGGGILDESRKNKAVDTAIQSKPSINVNISSSDDPNKFKEVFEAAVEAQADAVSGPLDMSTKGVDVSVVWADGHSVSLSDSFKRPLVIGYLGFDFPVDSEDGTLGYPVATQRLLSPISAYSDKVSTQKRQTREIHWDILYDLYWLIDNDTDSKSSREIKEQMDALWDSNYLEGLKIYDDSSGFLKEGPLEVQGTGFQKLFNCQKKIAESLELVQLNEKNDKTCEIYSENVKRLKGVQKEIQQKVGNSRAVKRAIDSFVISYN